MGRTSFPAYSSSLDTAAFSFRLWTLTVNSATLSLGLVWDIQPTTLPLAGSGWYLDRSRRSSVRRVG